MTDPIKTSFIGHIQAGLPANGGKNVNCNVFLQKQRSTTLTVIVQSSHPGAAVLPSGGRVTIPQGKTVAPFVLETNQVSNNIRVLISAHTSDGVFLGAHQDIRKA